jgi:Ser/Thr protein kinase RdoA (MazF antagonist)
VPDYVNGVALLAPCPGAATPDPAALLAALQGIEAAFGRVRPYPNAPRTLDLDLLDLGGLVREGPDPVLPHPRMQERGFVLAPLCDIAPGWVHPVLGVTAAELLAAEVPMVAPLLLAGGEGAVSSLHQHGGFAFSVSPRRGGRRPELESLEVLEWIGRFLARIHQVGASQAFVHRPALDLQAFGYDSQRLLLEGQYLPLDVASRWQKACTEALQVASGIWQEAGDIQSLRLHGDCHPGNILWTPEGSPGAGPHFVDLDDARMGPAIQDLWMLLSGERAQQLQQLGALLDGYEQLRELDRRELRLIEVLRTLRLIHYSAWLAQRWSDPIFPINFPWFGSRDYWQGQVDMLIEQTEAMQAPALVA